MKTQHIISIFILCITLTGCKIRTVYVPVERTITEYKDRLRLDSIYYRDTIRLFSRGDTVYKDVIRWRERFVRDTVYHERTDSIPVIVEKEVPVNYLTRWQQIRLQILNVITALLLIYLAYRFGGKGTLRITFMRSVNNRYIFYNSNFFKCCKSMLSVNTVIIGL